MDVKTQRLLDVAVLILTATATFVVLIGDTLGDLLIAATTTVMWVCIGLCWVALRARKVAWRSGWWLGFAAVVAAGGADTANMLVGLPLYAPYLPSTILYFASYLLGIAALVRHARAWSRWQHAGVALDGATMTTGIVVIFGSVAYQQLLNPQIPLNARLLGLMYPILDTFLTVCLTRLWFSAGGRISALRMMALSPLFLVADHTVKLLLLDPTSTIDPRWQHVWIFMFVGITISVTRPSVIAPAKVPPIRNMDITLAQGLPLAFSLATPGMVLLGFDALHAAIPWPPVAVGGLIMAVLMALRVFFLVEAVRERTAEVEDLARSDALTGAANRRRWDSALRAEAARRQSAQAREPIADPGGSRWIAILDLDHFKHFNDTLGHQAGDALLRDCVAAWTGLLRPGDLLARYGGEEFTLLLSAATTQESLALVDGLRLAMPADQTCSAGLVPWPIELPAEDAVRAADLALYQAKRDGRNRVVVGDPAQLLAASPGIGDAPAGRAGLLATPDLPKPRSGLLGPGRGASRAVRR